MIRGLKYFLALLIVALAAVLIVGYALPQAHRAAGSATLPAPPGRVFAILVDVARYAEWREEITTVEVLSVTPLKWREGSGDDLVTFEVIEIAPPERLRVRIADADLPFGGTWTYTLARDGDGTRLTIVEDGEVYNPVFRFVSRFVIGHTSSIDRFLADLRRSLD